MYSYIFVTGRASGLSQKELFSVLSTEIVLDKIFSSSEFLIVDTTTQLDVSSLIRRLGGTIKIAEVVKNTSDIKDIEKILVSLIKDSSNRTFGISVYNKNLTGSLIQEICRHIKNDLLKLDIKSRYILPTENNQLTSVVITKQKLDEYIIAYKDNNLLVARTLCVQDFEDWNKREFNRPYADAGKGMLPCKVARMMVNLSGNSKVVLDPFCGMGTILQEALACKKDCIGSDINFESITKAEKNLKWFCETYEIKNTFKLMKHDATHISEKISIKIDAIITEPFLGPSIETENLRLITKNKKTITLEQIKKIIKGLEKLYIGCLREWNKILKDTGVIVIIFPSFFYQGTGYGVKSMVDNCEKLGYIIENGPLPYYRPQAIVRRNIYVFKKIKI